MKIDVLYLCHGRCEFTEASLTTLYEQTDWELVSEFVCYHDAAGSAFDGAATSDLLQASLEEWGIGTLRLTNLGSPVAVMNHFLARTSAELFAKIDNDIIVPPRWLRTLADVMKRNPELELLGMEAGMSGLRAIDDDNDLVYGYLPASHIGGVGLMRASAFGERPKLKPDGRFGFTEWQHAHQPVLGWVQPDLRLFALDQLPFDPWESLTRRYVSEGINREWPKYDMLMRDQWAWWFS